MLLKSLEIHGFKSFADKTILDFHEGVTAIVGPNGCGKSNVVDAIRWVLGETSAKALRGGEMADVIFNGTDTRRAAGMAAVTLNLSNCEEALGVQYNEVAIMRRVYRDGKSEYRINNTICRLRDIHDLFLDTGIGRSAYSIMEQGKIDQLLSSKPEDRRAVFEEAAGVSKFKKEKKEALRKLEYTSANLLRVSDVLEEQERRIGSLKRQVSKARRFKDLSDDVKTLETHLSHQEYRELLAGKNQLQSQIDSLNKEITEKEKSLPSLEESLTEKRIKLSELEQDSVTANQNLSDAQSEIKSAEGQIKLNAERREDHQNRIQRNDSEVLENASRLSDQQSDLKDTIQQVEESRLKLSSSETTLTDQKEKLSKIRTQLQETEKLQKQEEQAQLAIERTVASLKAKLENYRSNTANTRVRANSLRSDHVESQKALATAQSTLDSHSAKLQFHEKEKTTLEEQKSVAERAFQKLRGDLDSAHSAVREEQSHLASRTSRLEVLENLLTSGEGLGKGTQAVLSGLDDPALYKTALGGTLAKLISTDDKYITAIEAALGHQLQAIIVEDDSIAASIIEKLKSKSLGTADLLVTTFTQEPKDLQLQSKPNSALGWALDLVNIKSKTEIKNVLQSLLESTLIVPDMEAALMLRPTYGDLKFVTLDGEVLTPEGFLKGGKTSGESTSALRLQNEITNLKKEISKRESEIDKAQKTITQTTESKDQASEKVEKAKNALQEHQINANNLKAERKAFQRDLTNFEQKISSIVREQATLEQRQKEAAENLSKIETELNESQAKRQEVEQKLKEFSTQQATIRREENESFNALGELQTEVAIEQRSFLNLQRQQEPLKARIKEILDLNMRREAEIKTLRERIDSSQLKDKELEESIGNCQAGIKSFSEKAETLKEQILKMRQDIQATETTLADSRRVLLSLTEKRGGEDVAYTKVDLKLENLLTTQRERHQVELSQFSPSFPTLKACLDKRREARTSSPHEEDENARDGSANNKDGRGDSMNRLPSENDTSPKRAFTPTLNDWVLIEEISSELRQKLNSMGAVNIDAIQEFEELEERHSFIRSQYDDLTSSKEELLSVIEKINTETTKMFSETFTKIKENFRITFRQLFGERGKADLILSDEEDPLESGIEIIAKPPGKKLQSITLLSGGERSMTAVALLFSIYMVKPSPFCVLDELDAPLDESNISRFLNLLENFISQSQFIIVTHNKRTMARADILYGVTMPEFGVSKPVGMILAQAEDIIDEGDRNKSSAASKTDKSQSPTKSAAAQISS